MMFKMTVIFLIQFLMLIPSTATAQSQDDKSVLLLNESKLRINGTSSVTDFSCVSEHELEEDTLSFNVINSENKIEISQNNLALEVDQFDCGKKGINRDFRYTFKSKQHPYININLKSLLLDNEKPDSALVDIEIAGVKRNYTVPLSRISIESNTITAAGKRILTMSAFGLTPPSPIFGLVKVSDEMEIEFELLIKEL